MKICKICIQPDSRPGLYFTDDDICGACLWEKEKANIDWDKRYDELIEIAKNVKSNNLKSNYLKLQKLNQKQLLLIIEPTIACLVCPFLFV